MPSTLSVLMRRGALFLACFAAVAGAVPVEVAHPVAPFLRRLEEKGAIRPGFFSTLPRGSHEVAAVLQEAARNRAALSDWDRRKLERFLNEFDPDRRRAQTRLDYSDSMFTVIASVEYYTGIAFRDSSPKMDAWAFGSLTPKAEGRYGEAFDFVAAASVAQERALRPRFIGYTYDPQQGMPYNVDRDASGVLQKAATFDGFRAVLGIGQDALRLEAGQDWNQWGPGHWQHTTLGARPYFWVHDSLAPSPADSKVGYRGNAGTFFGARRGYRYPGESAPLPQLRFRLGTQRWEYTKIVAERMGLSKDSSAWLVAHRLQLRLGNWKFAGTEMLAVGNRSMDPIVLLPGVPLKMAEHDGGDLDNSAMAGDIEYTLPGHGRVYAELMLDDFSGPPLNFWGNKFSWVAGGSWQDPFDMPLELHLEYAQVDPWVYGHHLYNTAMQSYGSLLGSVLPPNSRALFASAAFPLPGGVEGLVEWTFRQHDYKSQGSSIFDDYFSMIFNPEPKPKRKQFLARDVETRHEGGVTAEWSWKHHVQLKGGLGALWVSNFRGEPGNSVASPTAFGEVRLRY